LALLAGALFAATPSVRAQPAGGAEAVRRGEYVFRASGGCGCHTDAKQGGAFLSGGRPLKTPFGTFFSTNITPDPETGLGNWSEADFARAMRQGVAPDGTHYFPIFPYSAFTRISDADLSDLWVYLRAQPPVRQANKPPDVLPPFGWRFLLPAWKWLHFSPGRLRPVPGRDAVWNRGAYLVNALAHCAECHTPRGLSGGLRADLFLAGSVDGPEGELAPNLTPDRGTGIGEWSEADLVWFLGSGLKPNGDDTQGLMSETIENGLSHLSEADQRAIAVYLASLPPIRNKVQAPPKKK
jgi:mono/diheme cytochrome c family protein